MNYKVSVAENGKYIVCRVTGEITVALARQFTVEIDRLSRDKKIKRFLTDVRDAQNISDAFENYLFAYKDMKELDLQRDVRAAILVQPGDRSHDFVETVSKNAGYDVKIFDNEGAALAWLNG